MNTNKKKGAPLLQGQEGAAMVLVLCLMALFFVLSLTTLFSSSVLVGEARDDRETKQCRILATSFSQKLDEEMKTTTKWDEMPEGCFPKMVRTYIDYMAKEKVEGVTLAVQWPYYWEKRDATETSPLPGKVRDTSSMTEAVHTWKISNNSLPEGLRSDGYCLEMRAYWTFEDYDSFYATMRGTKPYDGILLVVDVVCSGKKRSYTVQNCYRLTVSSTTNDGSPGKTLDDFNWTWAAVWKEVV